MVEIPKVLHVGKYYPPFKGGMETFVGDLVKAQRLLGRWKPLVLAHGRPRKDSPFGVCLVPSLGEVSHAPLSPGFPWALYQMIRSERPRLLHLHLPNTSAFWALMLRCARRLPWVVHWHADVVPSKIDRRLAVLYRLYQPLEKAVLRRAAAVIATSLDYLAGSRPLQAHRLKCHVVPLGIDPERLPSPDGLPVARAGSLWGSDRSLRVLAAGRLSYYKGHEVLLRAAARVPGCRVILVGDGERRSALEKLRTNLALTDRVTLAGFLPDMDLWALMATADLFCLPSLEKTEAFGVVLLEARRYGVPVVASDIPESGVGWVVRTASCGALVPPGDSAALARILSHFSEDPSPLHAFRRHMARGFPQKFHIGRVAERLAAIYAQCV
ncbi:MAG: glycosyltransferase [Desulfosoma sp.]|uniref:glycosyltransferase n=1 Tax=Desulfosoma sp. TaxID=2603217 RepID=UPI004049AED2